MIESTLGKLLIAIITLTVLILMIVPMFTSLTAKATEDACRTSVLLRSAAVIDLGLFGKAERITPLTCSTYHEGQLEGTREEVKYQVSNLMSKCWYMYAEGRVDNIFDDHESGQGMCNVCSTFRIPDEMDLGGELYVFEGDQFMEEGEQYERQNNMIHPTELYGFLVQTSYNRGILYGGGTKNYIGGSHEWLYEFNFPDSNSIRYSQVERTNQNPFVRDYVGVLENNTIQEINRFALDLNSRLGSDMFVVVAQEFNNIDRTAARRLTEQLELNQDNNFNSILIMIDMKNGIVRFHAGIELENYLLEGEIDSLLRKHFSEINGLDSFNSALTGFITELEDKILRGKSGVLEDMGIVRQSYYNYITNNLQAPPPQIIESVDSSRTYAIAVVSYKDENKVFWNTVAESTYRRAAITAAGSGAGAAAGFTAGALACLWSGPGALACGAAGAVVGTLGGIAGGLALTSFVDLGSYDFNNSLIITPLNSLTGECNIYD